MSANDEIIKALIQRIDSLLDQNRQLIEILLAKPKDINDDWRDKIREAGYGLLKKDKCKRCGGRMETPMTTWIGEPPPKRCVRCYCESDPYRQTGFWGK